LQHWLRIEYSPCPLRATRSLLALRRRLADAFAQPHAATSSASQQPHHSSVGTLHPPAPPGALGLALARAPPPQTSHDNPLYFTLVRPLRMLGGAPRFRDASL